MPCACLDCCSDGHGVIPVLASRGQDVGDTFDIKNGRLIAKRADCFPKLPEPQRTPSSLPNLTNNSDINWGLGLEAPKIIHASGGAGNGSLLAIAFDQVSVAVVSIQEFRRTVDLKKCPVLASVFQGTAAEDPNLILVGEVYYGRRKLLLSFQDQVQASAQVGLLPKMLAAVGIKMGGHADAQSTRQVWLESQDVLPIAIRPAFVVQISGQTLGHNNTSAAPSWQPLDLDTRPSQGRTVERMAIEAAPQSFPVIGR